MTDLVARLTLPENLYWAWLKARRLYEPGDVWFDEAELACFEANLDSELRVIANQFERLTYDPSPMRPLIRPKKPGVSGKPEVAQAFWVPVRDQVAWIAFVNVIGPYLDAQMPPWSYAHRLYRSVWYEKEHDKLSFRLGPYRHSSGWLYRKWRQSWPLYRRYILLTIRAMSRESETVELGLAEERLLKIDAALEHDVRLPYLHNGFWKPRSRSLHWGSIDLKRFYPSISVSCVLNNLRRFSGSYADQIVELASSLLRFRIDPEGWAKEELERIGLQDTGITEYNGLPPGLFVSGFLANVALLRVDREVALRVREAQVAHFRYVDDHVVLARSAKGVRDWITQYEDLLRNHRTGASLNLEKVHPDALRGYLMQRKGHPEAPSAKITMKEVDTATRLDPRFPIPLTTKTLEQVSMLARTHFDLLHKEHQDHVIADLEHLLIADLPEHELRKDTRMAFAAAMLARIVPNRIADSHDLCNDLRERRRLCEEKGESNRIHAKLEELDSRIERRRDEAQESKDHENRRVFWLLMKAVSEHPEKIRLWKRVLEFCRKTGYPGLKVVKQELGRISRRDPLTGSYLRAVVIHVLATQILACARMLKDDEARASSQNAALSFLKSAAATTVAPPKGWNRKPYEQRTEDVLRCTVGTAVSVLWQKSLNAVSQFSGKDVDLTFLRRWADRISAISWESAPEEWAGTTGYPVPVWVWWAESHGLSESSTDPSAIWCGVLDKLALSDPIAWSVVQKHPRFIPLRLARKILKDKRLRLDEGWVFDLLRGVPENQRSSLARLSPQATKACRCLMRRSRELTLHEWAEWTHKTHSDNPFDPRVGEWTALAIVATIALKLCTLGPAEPTLKNPAFHPANFLVPVRWQEFGAQDSLSWEQWHDEMNRWSLEVAERKRVIRRERDRLRDTRFAPIWGSKTLTDIDWSPVHGLGMLLLGLLRRNFDWPTQWNPHGHLRAWRKIAAFEIARLRCSSLTTAILQACLMSRPRESLLLPRLSLFADSAIVSIGEDTAIDPPRVRDAKELRDLLLASMEILERYQITVHGHRPRQLIPVNVQQKTQNQWEELAAEVLRDAE